MEIGQENKLRRETAPLDLHTQIKKYRTDLNLSQEKLAEKVYVTRQTISNWENNKSYPDIHSLLLLSSTFDISLDQLIKGDVTIMIEEINKEEQKKFNQDGTIFTILLLLTMISAVPLMVFLDIVGAIIFALLFMITMYFALKVEKLKKDNNMQTYKEILAFTEGKQLGEIEKTKELAIRPYQKILIPLAFALITFVVCSIIAGICLLIKFNL